jgi:hypothetical protein
VAAGPLFEDWIWWHPTSSVNATQYPGPAVNYITEHGIAPYLNLGKNPQVMVCPSDPDPASTHARWMASGKMYPFSYSLNNLMTSEYAWYKANKPSSIPGSWNNIPNFQTQLIAAKITQVRYPSDKILVFEEADSTIDDGNGSMFCIPSASNLLNLVALRHDRNSIKDSAAETAPPSGKWPPPNPDGKGVCGFCDGHADVLPRTQAHSKYHCVPDLDAVPASTSATWN